MLTPWPPHAHEGQSTGRPRHGHSRRSHTVGARRESVGPSGAAAGGAGGAGGSRNGCRLGLGLGRDQDELQFLECRRCDLEAGPVAVRHSSTMGRHGGDHKTLLLSGHLLQSVDDLIGPAQPDLTSQLAAYGADRVLVLDNTGMGPVWGRQVVQSLAAAVHQAQPYAVLFASTPDGRDLASRVAAWLALGLTGDAIDLEIDEEGRLVQLKPALGGNVVAPILSKT